MLCSYSKAEGCSGWHFLGSAYIGLGYRNESLLFDRERKQLEFECESSSYD
jgi:hypothetical protein